MKRRLNDRLKNIREKKKPSSVDTKSKKNKFVGEMAQLLQQKLFNNMNNKDINNNKNERKSYKSVEKKVDVNEIITRHS